MIKLLFLTFFLTSCGHLFYQPMEGVYTTPDKFQIDYTEHRIKTSDELELATWVMPAPKIPRAVVLQFHGNAENMTTHFISLAWLVKENIDVITFDYRGYGQSAGEPDRAGIQLDAKAMIDFALKYAKQRKSHLIVYAQSLGGAVALEAVRTHPQKNEIKLLVADSAFSSYTDIAFKKLQSSWITFLLSPLAYIVTNDSTSAHGKIHEISPVPLLVIHDRDDQTVEFEFGQEIYDQAKSPKWLWETKSGAHIGTFFIDDKKIRQRFLQFLTKEIKI